MDIKPLDPEFQRAKSMPRTDEELIKSIMESVGRRFPDAKIVSDWEAGEGWVLFQVDEFYLVMLNATVPLLFVHPAVSEDVRPNPDRAVMVVERDVYSRRYSVDPGTILQTLNLIWPTAEVDPNRFSLSELSWATI